MMINSSALDQADACSFIPSALASLNIEPRDCKLTATSLQNSNKMLFSFTVRWEKEREGVMDGGVVLTERSSEVNTSCSSSTRSVSSKRKSSKDRSEKKPTEPKSQTSTKSQSSQSAQSHREDQQQFRIPGKVQSASDFFEGDVMCDGPCEGRYRPKEMTTLGRCGHYLCSLCSKIVYNTDGSDGCSAFNCVYQSVFDYLPLEYAKKAYDNHVRSRVQQRKEQRTTGETEDRQSVHVKKQASCMDLLGIRALCQENRTGGWDLRRRNNRRRSKRCKKSSKSVSHSSASESEMSNISASSVVKMFHEQTDRCAYRSVQTSKACPYEMINLRLLLFVRDADGSVRKVNITREVEASSSLKQAITDSLDDSPMSAASVELISHHSCPLRIFFCDGYHGASLRLIKHDEYDRKHLWNYKTSEGNIHFILDTFNFIRGKY